MAIWVHVLFLLLSMAGFLWQASQVSIQYFKYRTTNRIEQKLFKGVNPFGLALCIRYPDIVMKEKLLQETGIRMQTITDMASAISETSKLTIDQIFQYTPANDEVIESCMYRDTNRSFVTTDSTGCQQVIKVSKFYTLEYVCYAFRQTGIHSLTLESVTQSLQNGFKVGQLLLTPGLKDSQFLLPIIMDDGSLPFLSRDFAEVVKCSFPGCEIRVSPANYVKYLLPPPYDSSCIYVDIALYFSCLRTCFVKSVIAYDRVPLTLFLEEGLPFKHINYYDLLNTSLIQLVDKAYDACHESCFFSPCYTTRTVSFTSILYMGGEDRGPTVSVMAPRLPDMVTQAVPVMTFIDYFSLMCACFGTWFGLSFLSLNPFRTKKRKKCERHIITHQGHRILEDKQ